MHLFSHFKRAHGISVSQYAEMFPGVPYMSDKTKKKKSDLMSGEKNPGYNHQGRLSPFSTKFVGYSDMDESQSQEEIQNLKERVQQTMIENNSHITKLDYFTSRGYTEDEARDLLSQRQSTFSLEKCVEKYGREKGVQIWRERQEKWLATLDAKTEEEKQEINKKKLYKNGMQSKMEKKLFTMLKEVSSLDLTPQLILKRNDGSNKHYCYDIAFGNRIIEFNGDFWHANPKFYGAEDLIKHPKKPMVAKDIWARDKAKIEFAKSQGFDLIVVWESEFNESNQKTLDRCVEFLNK